MKARLITARERQIIEKAAASAAEKQMEDIAQRCQYLIFAAMIDYGLSPRTVNGVAKLLIEVKDKYAEYRTEELADYIFHKRLNEAGVKVDKVKQEL